MTSGDFWLSGKMNDVPDCVRTWEQNYDTRAACLPRIFQEVADI